MRGEMRWRPGSVHGTTADALAEQKPLQESLFLGGGGAPNVLPDFMCGEELGSVDELYTPMKLLLVHASHSGSRCKRLGRLNTGFHRKTVRLYNITVVHSARRIKC
jgi:hypothetical protein